MCSSSCVVDWTFKSNYLLKLCFRGWKQCVCVCMLACMHVYVLVCVCVNMCVIQEIGTVGFEMKMSHVDL